MTMCMACGKRDRDCSCPGRLLAAADNWERLADAEEEMARWNVKQLLGDQSVRYRKAETYRRTAKALRLEAETGRPHCGVCLGDHPQHKCPQAKATK